MPLTSKLAARLICRIFGHRWHFLRKRDAGGKVYLCHRCHHEAIFIR